MTVDLEKEYYNTIKNYNSNPDHICSQLPFPSDSAGYYNNLPLDSAGEIANLFDMSAQNMSDVMRSAHTSVLGSNWWDSAITHWESNQRPWIPLAEGSARGNF